MRAEIHDLTFTMDGAQVISFRTKDDCRELYETLKGKDLDVTAKKHREPRSLNANSYAWVLMDKLAAKMHIAKESLYKGYVKNIGGNNDHLYIADEAVGRFCDAWESYGLGWHNGASYGVHFNRDLDIRLKQQCQERFEKLYGHDKFMEVFGKSWL